MSALGIVALVWFAFVMGMVLMALLIFMPSLLDWIMYGGNK